MPPKISICIPTHDMVGKEEFLRISLDALWTQTMQDFEIVITDNSDDDKLLEVCAYYGNIRYYKNPEKGMARNTNAAIQLAKGSLVKILYLDDHLAHPNALKVICDNFDFNDEWLVTGCEHTQDGRHTFGIHYPSYNDQIHLGNNTIGSPSVLTIKNDDPLLFDESLGWLLDCDYYRRLFERFGAPVIVADINVVLGVGSHQETHLLSNEVKTKEFDYIVKKYNQ